MNAVTKRTLRDEDDYEQALELLDQLVDEVGEDESHPLYELLDTLGTLVQAYEKMHHPVPTVNAREVLRLLMEEHGLRQADLTELDSQGVIYEILSGKRELNMRQICALAKRFHITPAVFV